MTKVPDSDMNLRRYDLNLLPILKALLATHSVARSAEVLGLSQSATSGALTRLRGMFGDPLLVLVGRNLVPTPRALELQPDVEEAFLKLHAVFDKRVFVPAAENRRFIISTSDYVIGEIGVPLLNLLSAEAPYVAVKFVEVSSANRASIIGGDIDFVLTPQNNFFSGDDLQSMKLSRDEMVIISSSTFPVPSSGLDVETYLAADHAAYGVSDAETFEQWAFSRLDIKRRIRITVPQFNHLPRYVAETQCLAMMPRHVAERVAGEFGLKLWPVPFEIPKLKFSLFWSNVLHHNPAHIWFRQLVAKAWTEAQGLDQVGVSAE